MSYANKTFAEISRSVTEDFLHSVVVVDDQAYLHTSEKVGALVSPPARGGRRRTPETLPSPTELLGGEPEERRRHDLDAKTLTDAFAVAGLVCAVLRPTYGDGGQRSLELRTDRATQRADIVILDWRLRDGEEPGTTTLALIDTIVDSDKSDRLRLIAVYTGEPDLSQIADRIEEFLIENATGAVARDGYTLTRGAVRIALYAKAGGRVADPEAAARVVAEADLPDRLIDEFVHITQGLLSNVALKSLGALRDNTHRIIRKFSHELDAPYLAHRALMAPPDEAEQHPIPLLSSELQDVLEDRGVGALVSPTVIEAWLNAQDNARLKFDGNFAGMSTADVSAAMLELIANGVKDETSSKQHSSWAVLTESLNDPADRDGLSRVTELLTPDGVVARDRDMELALLMGVRTRYDAPSPLLMLGTVVAEERAGTTKYLLCIQPPCDSIRLKTKRVFPFLKVVDAKTSDAKDFDLVVRDGHRLVALRIDFHAYSSRLIELKPRRGHQDIRAAQDENGQWQFAMQEPDVHLRWVAELKPAQAQRVANLYGATIARVGLTESEWLRRMARPRD